MTSSPQQSPTSDRDFLVLKELEREQARRLSRNKLKTYRAYTKQKEFHAAGATFRERLFLAGNQLGKTLGGGMEAAMHLTGRYPDWWEGRRFDRPVTGWAAGVTGESTRDNPQRILIGPHAKQDEWGTGTIPGDAIKGQSRATHGVANLIDTVTVKHASGGDSTLAFKFYEKGREKWQGETLDFVWFDEEPPQDIYTEGLTRTNATGGMTYLTATPLMGATDVIKFFMPNPGPDRCVIQMTIDDAEHYTPEERRRIIDGYPEHEREARANGVPTMGSGRVFPIAESLLKEEAISIPEIWARIAGLDIGYDHPTACVWLAHDRDNDVIHVTDCYRMRQETPVVHSAAIKARGDWIPVAWPHDGLQHDKGSGVQIAAQYREQKVKMLAERATFDDGTSGVEAGILDMLDRMKTGRLKVAAHLNDWWDEFRFYHRKDGVIVKVDDDLMAATRYAMMMLRFAKTRPTPKKDAAPKAPAGAGGWMT